MKQPLVNSMDLHVLQQNAPQHSPLYLLKVHRESHRSVDQYKACRLFSDQDDQSFSFLQRHTKFKKVRIEGPCGLSGTLSISYYTQLVIHSKYCVFIYLVNIKTDF